MALTKLKKHNRCECVVVKNKNPRPHYARMICLDHKTWVQHVSKRDYDLMKKIGGIVYEN